jgi:GNAT superfamily N-acetyltransferase
MNVIVNAEDVDSADAVRLMRELSTVLATMTGNDGTSSFNPDDMRQPGARFAVARIGAGEAVGCGGLRPLDAHTAEVKRMYAVAATQGIGTAVLAFLEAEAASMGYTALWLSTRAVNQRAVAFYERRGYQRIPNFGKYAGDTRSVCFAKPLAS